MKLNYIFILALVLVLGTLFYLSNFRSEYAEGCQYLFSDQILIFNRSVYTCSDKSDFTLFSPINYYTEISREYSALLLLNNKFPYTKKCEYQIDQTPTAYRFTFSCPENRVKVQILNSLHSVTAPIIYSRNDYTPTLKQSVFSECGISQYDEKLVAACDAFKIEFEIEDWYISKTHLQIQDPDQTFSWLFANRAEVFSLLGVETEVTDQECTPVITSCGLNCKQYRCQGSEGWFLMKVDRDGRGEVQSRWGMLG